MGGSIAEKIAYLNTMGDANLDVVAEFEEPEKKPKLGLKDLVNI